MHRGSISRESPGMTLPGLHVPQLDAAAVPPLRFPPAWRPGKQGIALLSLAAAAALWLHGLHGLAAHTRHGALPAVAALVGLFVCGYCYVSGAVLQRRPWTHSRYGTRAQLALLCGLAPVIVAAGGGTWLLEGRAGVYVGAGFFAALHMALLDNVPFLQSFGCKFSSPRLWARCGTRELGFLAALLIAVGGSVAWLAATAAHDAAAVACRLAALLVPVAVWAAVHWRSHSLHVHHYLCAGAMLCITSSGRDPLAWVLHGVMLGLLVDGAVTWGLDPFIVSRTLDVAASDVPTVVWLSVVNAAGCPQRLGRLLRRMRLLLRHLDDAARAARDDDAAPSRPLRDGQAAAMVQLLDPRGLLHTVALPSVDALCEQALPPPPGTAAGKDAVALLVELNALLDAGGDRSVASVACACMRVAFMPLVAGSVEVSSALRLQLLEQPADTPPPAAVAAAVHALDLVDALGGDRAAYWEVHARYRALQLSVVQSRHGLVDAAVVAAATRVLLQWLLGEET